MDYILYHLDDPQQSNHTVKKKREIDRGIKANKSIQTLKTTQVRAVGPCHKSKKVPEQHLPWPSLTQLFIFLII